MALFRSFMEFITHSLIMMILSVVQGVVFAIIALFLSVLAIPLCLGVWAWDTTKRMLHTIITNLDFRINSSHLVVRLSGANWVRKQDMLFWGLVSLHTVQYSYTLSLGIADGGKWFEDVNHCFTRPLPPNNDEWYRDIYNSRISVSISKQRRHFGVTKEIR